MTDIDDMIKEIDQSVEWFCDKVVEPIPTDKQSREKVFQRMISLGWIRQSEVDTYKEITEKD